MSFSTPLPAHVKSVVTPDLYPKTHKVLVEAILKTTGGQCNVRATCNAVRNQCGNKTGLQALEWSKFVKIVDSALGAGIIRRIEGDGGITWLALKAPTNTNHTSVNQVRVASISTSASTTTLIKKATVNTLSVAASATVQDAKGQTSRAPFIQNQVQVCAEETALAPPSTGTQTPMVENAIQLQQQPIRDILTEDVSFTEEVCAFSSKHSHTH